MAFASVRCFCIRETRFTFSIDRSQTWKQTFGYDRYGNRTAFTQDIGGQQLQINNLTLPTIDQNTNRFTAGQGYSFDKNGNLVVDPVGGGRQFVFNGDNKQSEVKDAAGNLIGRYSYDGEGRRVKKDIYSGGVITETTVFVYSNGKLIAEYSTAPPPQNPTTNYTVTDQLGSPRVIVNAWAEVVSRRDFMPFGEELAPDANNRTAGLKFGVSDNIRQKFTGYQKDDETGLDFAEARMYENRHGRFTAVDPLLASGKSADPQTFNRYVYVLNNPLVLTDSDGLQAATRRDDLQRGCQTNCLGTYNTETNTVSGSSGSLIDLVVDAVSDTFQDIVETARDFVLLNNEPLAEYQSQRYGFFQDNGGPRQSPRLFGSFGPATDPIVDRTLESYEGAANIGLAGITLQSFFVGGFASNGSTITSNRGFAFRGSSFASQEGTLSSLGRFSSIFRSPTASNEVTVVGETMARVEVAASRLPGARTLNSMPQFTGTQEQVTSQMMAFNRRWFLNELRTRTIVNIGTDSNRVTPSIFYQMEQNMMKNYYKLHPRSFYRTGR